MKPGLEGFFRSMDAYFSGRLSERELLAAHPGWSAAPERLALYGRFVRGHLRQTLEKVYPLCWQAMPQATWDALVEGFRGTRPSQHFELNRAVASFPSFVADAADGFGLPPHLPALARFEWTDLEVYMDEEPIPSRVERLTPNPTLRVLEHGYRLCDFAAHPRPRPPAPLAEPEVALLWRHPQTHLTTFLRADAAALLVLKLALEGLTPAQAALAGDVEQASVEAEVARLADAGLVLRP